MPRPVESSPFSDTVHCDHIISLRFRSGPTSDFDLANADPDSPCTSLLEVSQDGAEERTTGKFLVVIATHVTFIDKYYFDV